MKSLLFALLTLFVSINANAQKKQILIIGTFHFDNPGLDVAQVKSIDIMNAKNQKTLEKISEKIKAFGPDKVFVEWAYDKQASLDKFYARSFDSLKVKNANEIVQLAMRTAKKLKHKTMYAIDYQGTQFPFDSLMKEMNRAGQHNLLKQIEQGIKTYEETHNKKLATLSLEEMLLDCNSPESIKFDMEFYLGIANKGGAKDNFTGAYLVSEWYRRNLYMYSLVQKLTEDKDRKVMVLLGSAHASILRDFIKHDPSFEIVELKDILK